MPAAQATAEPLRGFAYAPALPAEAAAALLRYLGAIHSGQSGWAPQ
jgi:hypothetical protein